MHHSSYSLLETSESCSSGLDKLGRAKPTTWAYHLTACRVIKTCISKQPKRLHEHLMVNSYTERRRPWRHKFFNNAKRKVECQMIRNRAGEILNNADFDWLNEMSNDRIRICLKKHFNMRLKTDK